MRELSTDGLTITKGPFTGQARYVPYFWEGYLDCGADKEEGNVIVFYVTSKDISTFPELRRRKVVRITDRDGLIVEIRKEGKKPKRPRLRDGNPEYLLPNSTRRISDSWKFIVDSLSEATRELIGTQVLIGELERQAEAGDLAAQEVLETVRRFERLLRVGGGEIAKKEELCTSPRK